MLIEKFLHDARLRGDLVESTGRWRYGASHGLAVPASFAESMGQRLESMSSSARAVLQTASLMGRDVDLALITRVGFTEAEARRALEEASVAHLVEPAERNRPHARFRHALTQEAVVSALPQPDRRATAGRALDDLESEPLDDRALEVAAALAGHAGDDRRSCALFIEAAERAVRAGATAAALTHLDAAEAVADADALHGVVIRECRLQALALAGRAADAIRIGKQLIIDLEAAADLTRLRRVHLALARARGGSGDWSGARDQLERLRIATAAPSPEEMSYGAIVAIELDDIDRAAELARAALAAAADSGVVECEAHEVLGRIARRESYSEAAAHFRRGVDSATRVGLDLWRARSLLDLGLSEATLYGRPDTFEEAFDAARSVGALSLTAMVGYNLANLCGGFVAEVDRAVVMAEQAIEAATQSGSGKLTAMGWIALGQAHGTAGRRGPAQRAADRARTVAPDDIEIDALVSGMVVGWSELVNGTSDSAWPELRRASEGLVGLPFRTATTPWYWGKVLSARFESDGLGSRMLDELRSPSLGAPPLFALLVAAAETLAAGASGDLDGLDDIATRMDGLGQGFPEMAPRATGVRALLLRVIAEGALAQGWAVHSTGSLGPNWSFEKSGSMRPPGTAPRSPDERARRPAVEDGPARRCPTSSQRSE